MPGQPRPIRPEMPTMPGPGLPGIEADNGAGNGNGYQPPGFIRRPPAGRTLPGRDEQTMPTMPVMPWQQGERPPAGRLAGQVGDMRERFDHRRTDSPSRFPGIVPDRLGMAQRAMAGR